MLVLTRGEGEEIIIGDPDKPTCIVRVASIRGDKVRLAFDAPKLLQINRREVAIVKVGVERAKEGNPA